MSEQVPPSADAPDTADRELSRWPRWSSDLHESLVSHEASAAELRQELDELRRTLESAPGRTSPGVHRSQPPPGSHRSLGGSFRSRTLLTGACVIVVVGAATGVIVRAARPGVAEASPAAPTATPTATPTSSATGTISSSTPPASAGAPSPVSAAPLQPWPGRSVAEPAGLPAHGVGADVGGTEVTAALAGDRRTVEIYERVLLAPGATALTLQTTGLADLARSLQAPLPAVQDLHAELDGRPVPVTVVASGWTVAAPGGAAASRLVLRYRLSGALVRPQPAPPGRYTLVVTPLVPSAADAADSVVVRVQDPRVEELYCPGASNQLCGRRDGALHVATVPAGAVPVVVALVTIPS